MCCEKGVLLRCVHCDFEASDFNGLCSRCGKFSPLPAVNAVTPPAKKMTASEGEGSLSTTAKPSPSKTDRLVAFETKASEGCGLGCALLILLAVPFLVMKQCSTPPPTAEQIKAEAAMAEADRRQGFHCLSGWDGSSASLVGQVKLQLREPDSFEHIETRITPEVNGKHTVMMQYRARNGFGGMNVATAFGTVDHQTCDAALASTGE